MFRPSYTYIDLFRNPNMRRISILAILLWMIISLLFDTTVRNISNLNFNIYVSFMVATAMELPADLLTIVGLNWHGRRWSSAIPQLACAVTMFSCAWLTGRYIINSSFYTQRRVFFFHVDQWKAQTVMFMFGRLFATYSMNLGFQFTIEVSSENNYNYYNNNFTR